MPMQTISQLFDLSGKSAVVTGGAKGIGQAVSFRLAEAGAGIMVSDIDMDAASKTAEEIQARGGRAEVIEAEASSSSDAEKTVQAALDAFGSVDILVNNAGIFPSSPVLETSETLWSQVIDINLKSVFLYSQAIGRAMVKSGNGGRIINLASTDSLKPTGMLAHYTASKGGVLMLTKAMAKEFGPLKIRVNGVAPASIATPGVKDLMNTMTKVMGNSADQIDDKYLQRVPLGRMGEPDDVAKVVLFLASDAADYITGEIIVIDGGYLLS